LRVNAQHQKQEVQKFWDNAPCGTKSSSVITDRRAYFEAIEKNRYTAEPFIPDLAQFSKWQGQKVLEIGCGAGTDHIQFLRSRAFAFGIDLSLQSIRLVQERAQLEGMGAQIANSDAENLPFQHASFDFIYSWGVIHHTPDTARAVEEIYRVLKPGGRFLVMVYHRYSWVVFLLYLRWGLFAGKPSSSIRRIVSEHMESTGTKAYTRSEAIALFQRFEKVSITSVLTPWDDLRYHCPGFLQRFWAKWVRIWGNRYGWFLVVSGRKPE